jgi:hypothetical protein
MSTAVLGTVMVVLLILYVLRRRARVRAEQDNF